MSTSADVTQTHAITRLQRIRRISRPLVLLITVALALLTVSLLQAGVLLLYHQIGSPDAYVSFTPWGVGMTIGHLDATVPALVPVESLSVTQRLIVASLLLLSTTCAALMLLQIRRLFILYSRGVIFAEENAGRIKRFALWLVAHAVAVNVSARIFAAVVLAPPLGTSNAALILVLGAMIYVIGHVMDLGRDADLERREFI
jgi:hypothetical protein